MFMGKGCGIVTSDYLNDFLAMNPRFRFEYDSDFDHRGSDSTFMFPVKSSDLVASEVDFFAELSKKPVVKEETAKETSRRDVGVNTGLQLVSANTRSEVDFKEKSRDELLQIQKELDRLNVENQKLRVMLNQAAKDYSALRSHMDSEPWKNRNDSELEIIGTKSPEKRIENGDPVVLQHKVFDLVSDDQSTFSSNKQTLPKSPKMDMNFSSKKRSGRNDSPDSEGWAPEKAPKLDSALVVAKAVDSLAEATMRKARVSIRARSDAPMISDGCQWRKYGQKIAKGNPCPRAYYRCTMAIGCPVRKQVQRCPEDRTILVTTYEGNHNHPLPPAAMPIVSTTSAAASMLLSGTMPSADGLMNPNILARTILPYSSNMATISASAPFPTITLDFTNSAASLRPPPQQPPQHFPIPLAPTSNVITPVVYNQSTFSGLQVSRGMLGQPSLAEALSATTAAITADPNFMTALAAAVSSIIGGGGDGGGTINGHSNSSNTGNVDTNTSNSNKSDSSFMDS